MKKISEIKNREEVEAEIVKLLSDHECTNYQEDIYLYIDDEGKGSVDIYMNVGGNSWLNDDHVASYPMKPDNDGKLDRLLTWFEGPEGLAECVGITIPEVDECGFEVDPWEFVGNLDEDVFQKAWDEYKCEEDTAYYREQATAIVDNWIWEEEING